MYGKIFLRSGKFPMKIHFLQFQKKVVRIHERKKKGKNQLFSTILKNKIKSKLSPRKREITYGDINTQQGGQKRTRIVRVPYRLNTGHVWRLRRPCACIVSKTPLVRQVVIGACIESKTPLMRQITIGHAWCLSAPG